jgi:2,5-diketo-D-gluconate reductase A
MGNIVIPKSSHPERMRENLGAAEISLGRDEMYAVSALDGGERVGADPAEADFTQM